MSSRAVQDRPQRDQEAGPRYFRAAGDGALVKFDGAISQLDGAAVVILDVSTERGVPQR